MHGMGSNEEEEEEEEEQDREMWRAISRILQVCEMEHHQPTTSAQEISSKYHDEGMYTFTVDSVQRL